VGVGEADPVRRRTQALQLIVTVAGPQDADVVAHRPGTDGAAIGVRVGGALLHVTDAATVGSFLMAWKSGARHGRDLPVRADQTGVVPTAGTALPAAYMEAGQCPPAVASLQRGRPGQASRLWVTLGRMTFDVLDQEALVTTMVAFRRAARMAPSVFLPTPDQRAIERTAAAAARLLAAPSRRSPSTPATTNGTPAVAASRRGVSRTITVQPATARRSPTEGLTR
jgi:hypothetical protein